MDALPAALRSSSTAILMNCQRVGKLPQRKLYALDKEHKQMGMAVRIEAGAGQLVDQPRQFRQASPQLPGFGAIPAVLARVAVGLRRARALGIAGIGSA